MRTSHKLTDVETVNKACHRFEVLCIPGYHGAWNFMDHLNFFSNKMYASEFGTESQMLT